MASELDRARHLSSDPALHLFPTIISHEYTGARPRIHIDPTILEVALDTHGPTQLAQVFQVHPRTIRHRALEAGIRESAPPVYVEFEHEDGSVHWIHRSSTGASTNISDNELDKLVLTILESFPSLGRRMINGSLKHMGVTIPRSRLIRWKFVIHAFIDGFSRLIVGLLMRYRTNIDLEPSQSTLMR
ncbi:hypothetical protein C8J56DRAFT_867666 [Mycena floridula]|nr:hypothetical protein C8J56DRAFT_867666 [Mycena floridula]